MVIWCLICRHAQTIDYVIVQTLDPFPQNFFNPDRLKQSKILNDELTKSLYSPSVPIIFHKCKNFFLQAWPKHFIAFLCECIINLLEGNLQSPKRHHVAKFQNKVRLLSLKRSTWKQRRNLLASEKGLLLPSLTICLDMEQFLLVPASTYNKNFITQSVAKQELPKYQLSQNPTYQIDSPKKEINKKLLSKADSLVDKILSCPRIKLSSSQTLFLDGIETGLFLLNFAQQLRRKNADVPDIYFSLLDAAGKSPSLILNQNAKAKERRSWAPFKI